MILPLRGLAVISTVVGLGLVSAPTIVAAQPIAAVGAHQTARAATSVQNAIDIGAEQARYAQGASTFAVVIDRRSGKVLARTDNADQQVASESIAKLFVAAYYLITYKGKLPADIEPDLRRMIELSDDDLGTAYWNDDAIPTVVQRYHLTGIQASSPDPGYWGGTAITATGMATFMYEMSKDPQVGPWLIDAMTSTTDYGTDGYNQNYGFNTVDGVASKQGWGSDNDVYDGGEPNAVHSVGLTKYYAAAVLQTGPSGTYRTMGSLATDTVDLVLQAPVPPAPVPPQTTAPKATAPKTTAPARPGSDLTAESRNWWLRAVGF